MKAWVRQGLFNLSVGDSFREPRISLLPYLRNMRPLSGSRCFFKITLSIGVLGAPDCWWYSPALETTILAIRYDIQCLPILFISSGLSAFIITSSVLQDIQHSGHQFHPQRAGGRNEEAFCWHGSDLWTWWATSHWWVHIQTEHDRDKELTPLLVMVTITVATKVIYTQEPTNLLTPYLNDWTPNAVLVCISRKLLENLIGGKWLWLATVLIMRSVWLCWLLMHTSNQRHIG